MLKLNVLIICICVGLMSGSASAISGGIVGVSKADGIVKVQLDMFLSENPLDPKFNTLFVGIKNEAKAICEMWGYKGEIKALKAKSSPPDNHRIAVYKYNYLCLKGILD